MRSILLFRPRLLALAAVLAVGGMVAAAQAGSRYHDRIYADSFGNLVIHSPAGYKRIIVGAGHLAKQLTSYEQTGEEGDDDVVYLDEDDGKVVVTECYRPPVFLKGRSYMYGLADGEMPDFWDGCD
jgi:hypothetical protein